MLDDLRKQHVAAVDDFRMGRCDESQFRRQLERLGFSPAASDIEVAENRETFQLIGRAALRVVSKVQRHG